jgi:hypothetical protein
MTALFNRLYPQALAKRAIAAPAQPIQPVPIKAQASI